MANIPTGNYSFSKLNIKNGFSQLSNQIEPQLELTLAFNPSIKKPSKERMLSKYKNSSKSTIWVPKYRPLSLGYVTSRYYAFIYRIEEELFGENCHKDKTIQLIKHIGVVEHLDTNPHIHASINLPDDELKLKFIRLGKKLWETKIQKSGELIANFYRGAVWDNYIVKDIYKAEHSNLVLLGGK
jgi:hypothetical protein